MIDLYNYTDTTVISKFMLQSCYELLIMRWMIPASVFIALYLAPAYAQPMAPLPSDFGTCASIGYSMSCCPQTLNRDTCRASDGNCNCGHDCHLSHNNDCCSDVACPNSKSSQILRI